MKTVNVSELEGAALDWAVAKALQVSVDVSRYSIAEFGAPLLNGTRESYSPSKKWSQGGPLIEEMDIGMAKIIGGWGAALAECDFAYGDCCIGPTPLIAACRAIVAAKMGDTIEVPEELL